MTKFTTSANVVIFVVMLSFFVNSKTHLNKRFIYHVIDIYGLHHKNWVTAILIETLDSICACQEHVRVIETFMSRLRDRSGTQKLCQTLYLNGEYYKQTI